MTTALRFTKGHGTGNDFVLVADPDGAVELTPPLIAALCDRHFGVGADGVIRAVRAQALPEGRDLVEAEPTLEWFMDYHNADGSAAEMCGNGIRVYVHFLLERGLLQLDEGESVPIGTRAGVRRVRRSPEGYEVDLGTWLLGRGEPVVRAKDVPVARPGLSIDLGNPHVVVALADDEELEAADLSFVPQVEPAPVEGANVELVVPRDPLVEDGIGRIRMRVHERGSGETLSCGTGAAAAALATRHWAGSGGTDRWQVDVPGGRLQVTVRVEGGQEHVHLGGPADLVYEGTVDVV